MRDNPVVHGFKEMQFGSLGCIDSDEKVFSKVNVLLEIAGEWGFWNDPGGGSSQFHL